jgi:hypothetical protein
MQPKTRNDLMLDLTLVVFLVGLDVLARLVPHVPGIWPVAASALFAGRMLRVPVLAFVVPVAAVVLSNFVLAGDDGRVMLSIVLALCVPTGLGILARRWRGVAPTALAMIGSSLAFFAITNFAVWAFNDMYPMTVQGLAECYAAALPFLDRTVIGDLAWCAALFGGAWLVQHAPSLARRTH